MKSPVRDKTKEWRLASQLGYLQVSCESYDAGFREEAARLAVIIRVLVHDATPRGLKKQKKRGRKQLCSKSVLRQMNLKDSMKFLDTSESYDSARHVCSFHGLAYQALRSARFLPKRELPPNPVEKPSWVSFKDWWEKTVIVDSLGSKFSRKRLILSLANQDGGAHVDPDLEPEYEKLTRKDSMGWRSLRSTVDRPVTEIETATCRQIAHEMLESLREERSSAFSLSEELRKYGALASDRPVPPAPGPALAPTPPFPPPKGPAIRIGYRKNQYLDIPVSDGQAIAFSGKFSRDDFCISNLQSLSKRDLEDMIESGELKPIYPAGTDEEKDPESA